MNFNKSITNYKRTWFIGKFLNILLLLAAILAVVVLCYGLADSVWALSPASRKTINLALIISLVLIAAFVLIRALRTPLQRIATHADNALQNPAKSIRAAADLSTQDAPSPLQEFLTQQAQAQAAKQIQTIPLKHKLPLKSIAIALLCLALTVAIAIGIRAAHTPAFDTVASRLLHPSADIPPYSPLKFEVSQKKSASVYGGDNHVSVTITGAEIEDDVVCLIRDPHSGKIKTINTFQESKNTFSKKFTNITNDIEFAFACGHARSAWNKITCLLQPKFTDVLVKITPPSYTQRKPIEFPLEGNEIKVITGSTITLTVTSNRPLADGEVTPTPLQQDSSDTSETLSIPAAHTDQQNKISFTWTANHSADISCIINDIRSTPAAKPLKFTLITIADQAPAADISSVANYVLATPSSTVPIHGKVNDDFMINSVYLVRTLVGFRDRAKLLTSSVNSDTFEFNQKIPLKQLGVSPGQTLEFYLEANDNNPSLLGIGTSDVFRIGIISEEEYARKLRSTIDMRKFKVRFKKLTKAIRAAVESLRKLNDANQKNDSSSFNNARGFASETHQQSRKIALAIGEDFEAFELEAKLTETAIEIADRLLLNIDDLDTLDFNNGVVPNQDMIAKMIERLGALLKRSENLQRQAEDIQKWAKVSALAAQYLTLYHNQRSITSRIGRITLELHKGIKRNAKLIEVLGETQQKNKKLLLKFAKDLKAAAAELPPKHADLAQDCEAFLDTLAELNIPEPMEATTNSCRLGKAYEATEHAHLALQLMQQLLDMEGNLFADLINGRLKRKKGQPEDVDKTMQQLLQALLEKSKPKGEGKGKDKGQGNGNGIGNGFGQGNGQLQRNNNAPMFGPKRHTFDDDNNQSGKGPGRGSGSGKGNHNQPKISGRGSIDAQNKHQANKLQSTRSNIPSKYKDAVKRFYSTK